MYFDKNPEIQFYLSANGVEAGERTCEHVIRDIIMMG